MPSERILALAQRNQQLDHVVDGSLQARANDAIAFAHKRYYGGGEHGPMPAESLAHGVYNAIPNLVDGLQYLAEYTQGGQQYPQASRHVREALGTDYLNSEFTPSTPIQKAISMVGEGVADPLAAIPVGRAGLTGLQQLARNNQMLDDFIVNTFNVRNNMVAYHGSPHKFDRFDHSKMGTGEGAQAYGWGTYIAENPEVAKSYATDLAYGIELPGAHPAANRQIARDFAGSDFESAADIPDEWYQEIANDFREAGMDDVARSIETADKTAVREVTPNQYSVDLPDEKIAQMLDWDAPLSEQPESVRAALIKAYADSPDTDYVPKPNDTGQDLYGGLNTYGGNDSQQGVSLYLKQHGIPGIKYLDGNSRSAGQGSRNFVVFDENDMSILTRNGEPVAQNADSMRVAARTPSGEIITFDAARTHSGILDNLEDTPEKMKGLDYGFVDNTGKYYTRKEAMDWANNQRLTENEYFKRAGDTEGLLFGEDLDEFTSPAQQADSLPMGSGFVKREQLGPGISENAGVKEWREKITKTGQVMPIEIDKSGFIVDGEHRYKALLGLGVEEIPVYVGEQMGASGRLVSPYSGISVGVKIPTKTQGK